MSRYVRVLMLAALTSAVLRPARSALIAQTGESRPAKTRIDIVAERFRFTPDEIRMRRGATIEFVLESDDTDHGFRIAGTGIDRIIPKRGRGSIVVEFTPERAGRYTFECSKLCGAGHEFMHGVVIVEE